MEACEGTRLEGNDNGGDEVGVMWGEIRTGVWVGCSPGVGEEVMKLVGVDVR